MTKTSYNFIVRLAAPILFIVALLLLLTSCMGVGHKEASHL